MEKLPRLEYSGQSTAELIALKHTYGTGSLLRALELGLQAKRNSQGAESITAAEWLVLAVRALDREVNNGGYQQLFFNSSRQFVPIIVDSLSRIQCHATAAVTEKAIAALGLTELSPDAARDAICTQDPVRDEILQHCDQEFYKLAEIGPKLFSFVEAHQDEIHPLKPSAAPCPQRTPGSTKIATFRELVRDMVKQRSSSGHRNPN